MQTLYDKLKEAGCQISNHESDLYVEDTQTARDIITAYAPKLTFSCFINNITKTPWIDIPFMYSPWWEARAKKA